MLYVHSIIHSVSVIEILIRTLNQEALQINLSLLLRMKNTTLPLNLWVRVMTSLQTRSPAQEYQQI